MEKLLVGSSEAAKINSKIINKVNDDTLILEESEETLQVLINKLIKESAVMAKIEKMILNEIPKITTVSI